MADLQNSEETLGSYLTSLAGAAGLPGIINWPPDAFACAASLLERSGAYIHVVSDWPPPIESGHTWSSFVGALGSAWKDQSARGKEAPEKVSKIWAEVLKELDLPTRAIGERANTRGRRIFRALVKILAAADEACMGVGIPGGLPFGDKLGDQIT